MLCIDNILSLLSARETGQSSQRRGWRHTGSGARAGSGDLRTWASQYALKHCTSEPCALGSEARSTIATSVSPDGTLVASTHGDHSVKIVDYSTGRLVRELTGHRRTPWTVKFHPLKSSILVSGSLDNEVRIWNAHTGQLLQCRDFGRNIASVAFHPTGKFLAVAAGHKLFIWVYQETSDRFEEVHIVLRTAKTIRTVHFHPLAFSYILTTERVDPQCPVDTAGTEQWAYQGMALCPSQRHSHAPMLERKVSMASSASSAASDILYLNRSQQGDHVGPRPVGNQDWGYQTAFQVAPSSPAVESGTGHTLVYRRAARAAPQLSNIPVLGAEGTETGGGGHIGLLQPRSGNGYPNNGGYQRPLSLLVEHEDHNMASTTGSTQFATRSGTTAGQAVVERGHVQGSWNYSQQTNRNAAENGWSQGAIGGQDALSLGDFNNATQQSALLRTSSSELQSEVLGEFQGQNGLGHQRPAAESSASRSWSQLGLQRRSSLFTGITGEGFTLGAGIERATAEACAQHGHQQQSHPEMAVLNNHNDENEHVGASFQILAHMSQFPSEGVRRYPSLQRSTSFAYGQRPSIVPQSSGQINNSGYEMHTRFHQGASRAAGPGRGSESRTSISQMDKENMVAGREQQSQRAPPFTLRLHARGRTSRSSSWSPGAASSVMNNNLNGSAITRIGDVSEVPALTPAMRTHNMYASLPSQELPCTAKLSLWKFFEDQPSRCLDSKSPQMVIQGAVLCSEMGVHIASCGRIFALCTATLDACVESHVGGFGAFRYEVKVYSLEPGTMGQVIRSREISAGHCLTSIQFSPDCTLLLLSYGKKHASLVRGLVSDQQSIGQIRSLLEVYRVSDLALIRVLHSIDDDANTACFHPFPGEGILYGTKDGKLRILRTATNENDVMDASQFEDELLSVDELLAGETDWEMGEDMEL